MDLSSSLLERIETGLASLFASGGGEDFSLLESSLEEECQRAHRHPLLAGGKRIRPLVLLQTACAVSGEAALEVALPAALALELVHTYSLVHDDLPCMDNDDFRRGVPTTHKLFGEAKGLLVGDGLLTRAFALLAEAPVAHVRSGGAVCFGRLSAGYGLAAAALSRAAGSGGMVLGQWFDMSTPTEEMRSSWPWVRRVAQEKTGRLLAAALEMGLLLGLTLRSRTAVELIGDDARRWAAEAHACGVHTGIAFQCIDDILDVTATSTAMGKTVGKDTAQGKATAVTALGLEGARAMAREHTELALAKLALLRSEVFQEQGNALEETLRGLLDRRM